MLTLLPTTDDMQTNAAFEALMWALSRPGIERMLPARGMAVIAESLLDQESSFHTLDDADLERKILRIGARAALIGEADYVFARIATENEIAALSSLCIGTLAYPDQAATLIAPAHFGLGQTLRLTGPGIKGSVTISIDGIAPTFWRMRERAIRYPLGWDLYLVDGDRVIGLPRSTKIEVL